jgi:hypothetical protein
MSGLKHELLTQGSPLSNLNGGQGPQPDFAQSKVQDTYSINGIPNLPNLPPPSQLDLQGEVPAYNYADNAPEGASF